MGKILVLFILCVQILLAQNIDDLLRSYAQEADLSTQTKKENAGSVIILKRSDIDRLRLRTLAELIDLTPFINYSENYLGFGFVYNSPHEGEEQNMIRIFIDDREVYFPYFGGSLALFSRLNIDFIDHAEIYFGLTSFEFGIEPAIIVFKLYTKEASRENTSLISISGSSRNAKEAYVYSAMAYDDLSYLISLSLNDMRLNNDNNEHLKIDRDFQTLNLFTKLGYKNHEFQLNTMFSEYNNQLKNTPAIAANKNNSNMYYIYGAWRYISDFDLKILLNYTKTNSKNKIFTNTNPQDLLNNIYIKNLSKIKEENTDFQLSKKFYFSDLSFDVGYKARYKKFRENTEFATVVYSSESANISPSSTEFISSFFADSNYHLNENNILNLSLKYDFIKRSSEFKNDELFGARIGYVYSGENWYFKLFGSFSEVSDSPYPFPGLYHKDAKKEKVAYISTEFGIDTENSNTALMLARVLYKKNAFSVQKEQDDALSFNAYLTNSYKINSNHNINTNLWLSKMDFKMPNIKINDSYYGGFLSTQSKFGKFDLVNTLIYKDGDLTNAPGYNYNLALNYEYSKNLTFYIKGLNLLNKDLKYRYRVFTRNSMIPQTFDISTYDRTFWLGLEYQFWKSLS